MDGEKKEDKPHSDGDDFASEQLDAQHFCAEPQSDVVSAGVLAAQRSLDAISVGISCIKGSAKAMRCSCAASRRILSPPRNTTHAMIKPINKSG